MKKVRIRHLIFVIIIFCTLSSVFIAYASFNKILPPYVDIVSDMIGGSARELASHAQKTSDGGILFYSRTASSASGDVSDINPEVEASWVIKMDSEYNIEWDTIVSQGYNTVINDMIETSSGDYVGVGYRMRSGEKPDEYIVSLNSKGEEIWNFTTGDYEDQRYNSIVETPTGYIIVGRDDKESAYTHSGLTITKTNFEGATEKELFIDGSGAEEALKIVTLNNGNYGVFANSDSNKGDFSLNHGENDIVFYEINDNLNIIRQRMFGSEGEDRFSDAYVKDDGNILVSGYGGETNGDITVPIDISGQSAWLFEINFEDLSVSNQISLPTAYSNGGDICVIDNYIFELVRDASAPYLYILNEDFTFVTKEKLNDRSSLYVNMEKLSDESLVFTTTLNSADGIFSGTTNGDADIGYSIVNIKSPIITADSAHTNPINNPLTAEDIKTLYNVSAVDSTGKNIAIDDIAVDFSKVIWNSAGDYPIHFSVTDSYGRSASKDSKITIEASPIDTIIPEITADSTAQIEAGTTTVNYINLFHVSAQDNVDGNITDKIEVDSSAVDLNTVGNYPVKFNVKDSSNNFANEVISMLDVVDTTAPTLKVDDEQSIEVDGKILNYKTKFNASAYDVVDGDMFSKIEVDSSLVNLSVADDYEVTFSVEDSHGNKTEKVSTLHVINNTKPTITASDEAQVGLNATSIDYITLFNINAEDGNGNIVTDDIIIDDSKVDLTTVGNYPITFNYTREDGVSADEVEATLHVVDMPPVLLVSPHEYISLGDTIEDYIDFFNVSATDDKDGNITTLVEVDTSDVDLTTPKDYEVVFSVKDTAGNYVSSTSILTVQNTDLFMNEVAKNTAYACKDNSCDNATDIVDIDSFENLIIEEQIIKIIDDGVEQEIPASIPSNEIHYLIDGTSVSQDEITYQINIINNGNKDIKDISISNTLNLNQIEGTHDLDIVSIKEYDKNNLEVGHEKKLTQRQLYDNNNKVQWNYDLPAQNYLQFTIKIKLNNKLEKYLTTDEVFSSVVNVCFNSEGHYADFDNTYTGNICLSDGADLNIDIDGGGVDYVDPNFTIQKFIIDSVEPFNNLVPGENLTIKIDITNNNALENNLKQTILITDEFADMNIAYESALNNPLLITNKTYSSPANEDVFLSSGDNLYETNYNGTNATLQNLLPQSNVTWVDNSAKNRWSTFTNNNIQGGIHFSLKPNEKYEIEFQTAAKGQFKNNKLLNFKQFWRFKY